MLRDRPYKRYFDRFYPKKESEFYQSINTLNDITTFDYQNYDPQVYIDKFYNITIGRTPKTEASINNYLADLASNNVKIKTYTLTSDKIMYQASGFYSAVRAKYIFYQGSGNKIVEDGSGLGKWYWQDIEVLFVTPGPTPGRPSSVAYMSIYKLNQPQPYFK